MMEEMKRQDALIQELTTRGSSEGFDKVMEDGDGKLICWSINWYHLQLFTFWLLHHPFWCYL